MSEAESCFRAAIEQAHRGGRRSLEVQAATSLSRLLQSQGQRHDARRLLEGIHSWFTEGFDTADHRGAKALLDALSEVEVKSSCASSSPTATSASASSPAQGKRQETQEHLTTATTMYREMDMRFWLEQAEVEMRQVE